MKYVFTLLAFLFCSGAHAQDALVVQSCGTLPQQFSPGTTRQLTVDVNGNLCGGAIFQSILCTTNGATVTCGGSGNFTCTAGAAASCTVPSSTTGLIQVDGCAAGGGGGLGQASANTAGGGGGGGGECYLPSPISVAPAQVLNITVGAGVVHANGANTALSGATTAFKTLIGGLVGADGAAGVGGTGGNGRGAGGSSGGTAGNPGNTVTLISVFGCGGAGGGGGATTAGSGGTGGSAGGNSNGSGPTTGGVPGGVDGGGGGGASCYGQGGSAGTNGGPGLAPTIGFGAGAGGDGTNNVTTVAGGNGFLRITGYW